METFYYLAEVPASLHSLIKRHLTFLREVLPDTLVGVYVHGSVATGGFVFNNSDFDYLVVLSQPLNEAQFVQLTTFYRKEDGPDIPANGIEVSFVLGKYVAEGFVYPTPFEFHAYTAGGNLVPDTFGPKCLTDPDLATHFMLTYHLGIPLLGPPAKALFREVPARHFLASIKVDCAQSYQDITTKTPLQEDCRVPRYAVLNYCRTLAYLEEGSLLSKVAGGRWGLENLPQQFHSLIVAALAEQQELESSALIPGALLVAFAEFAESQLASSA